MGASSAAFPARDSGASDSGGNWSPRFNNRNQLRYSQNGHIKNYPVTNEGPNLRKKKPAADVPPPNVEHVASQVILLAFRNDVHGSRPKGHSDITYGFICLMEVTDLARKSHTLDKVNR
jgi:hypothetical protein